MQQPITQKYVFGKHDHGAKNKFKNQNHFVCPPFELITRADNSIYFSCSIHEVVQEKHKKISR